MKLKYQIKRLLVKWRRWQTSINDTISVDKIEITAYEQKAIRLWKMYLKDKESILAYNAQGVRQIEKETLFIIFQSSGNLYHLMTIMDVNDSSKTLFELHIPEKEAKEICDIFDTELEKRMKKVENDKRKIIEHDLDKLLKIQELQIQKPKN